MTTDANTPRDDAEAILTRSFLHMKPFPEISDSDEISTVAGFLEEFSLLSQLANLEWVPSVVVMLPTDRKMEGIMNEIQLERGVVRAQCRRLTVIPENHSVNMQLELYLFEQQDNITKMRVGVETNHKGEKAKAKVEIYGHSENNPVATISFNHMDDDEKFEVIVTTDETDPRDQHIRDVANNLENQASWALLRDTFVFTAGLTKEK